MVAGLLLDPNVRRRFVKRVQSEGSPIAEQMLRQIALLYQTKKTVRGEDVPMFGLAARRERFGPESSSRSSRGWDNAAVPHPPKSQLAEGRIRLHPRATGPA